jgi:hypothetical protein
VLLLLSLQALAGALLDLGLGLIDSLEALLTPCDLGGHVHAVGNARAISLLAQPRPAGSALPRATGLRSCWRGPRQRLVLAGVDMHRGAIQRNDSQLQALNLAREHEHLHEPRFHLRQEAPPEAGNRVVVGVGVGRHEPERHRVVRRRGWLSATSSRSCPPPPGCAARSVLAFASTAPARDVPGRLPFLS